MVRSHSSHPPIDLHDPRAPRRARALRAGLAVALLSWLAFAALLSTPSADEALVAPALSDNAVPVPQSPGGAASAARGEPIDPHDGRRPWVAQRG